LIAEHPNVRPVGLRNSLSDVDISAILTSDFGDDDLHSDMESTPDDKDMTEMENIPSEDTIRSKKRKVSSLAT
jgi:hypothetical protein